MRSRERPDSRKRRAVRFKRMRPIESWIVSRTGGFEGGLSYPALLFNIHTGKLGGGRIDGQ